MMSKWTSSLVAVTLVLAMCVSCRSDSSQQKEDRSAAKASPMAIEEIDWRLINLRGSPVEPAPAGTRAPFFHLTSEGKRVGGYTGVNDLSGSYELSGQTLRVSPLAMTRRAGLPPLMRLEASFVDALHETNGWRRVNGDIELFDVAGQPLARFTRGGGGGP
jgi:putative lipoprotein